MSLSTLSELNQNLQRKASNKKTLCARWKTSFYPLKNVFVSGLLECMYIYSRFYKYKIIFLYIVYVC